MEIRVECYSGYRGEETPRALWLGTKKICVKELLDHWVAPDHRYFKIRAGEGDLYIIRHDPHAWLWELVFYKSHGFNGSRFKVHEDLYSQA